MGRLSQLLLDVCKAASTLVMLFAVGVGFQMACCAERVKFWFQVQFQFVEEKNPGFGLVLV